MIPRSRNVLCYGSDTPLPPRVPLRAGPLSVVYEAGDLRYIRLGDREIVRRVYGAVRDRNWGTVPARLSNVSIESTGDTFSISYDAEHRQDAIDFRWHGSFTGTADGTITCTMDGVARSTFWRNRIGFCVLHPIDACAGHSCTVEHSDGTLERGLFPRLIAPHQPFKDIAAITHEVAPGVQAALRFVGDIFEMEDQRNWSDASFKTYSTPLDLPFPVEVARGTRITQSVTLRLKGTPVVHSAIDQIAAKTFRVSDAPSTPLPAIGLGMASHGEPLSDREIARLRALNLAHLRLDLDLAVPDVGARLRQASAEAQVIGVPLEIAIFVSDADEIAALRDLLHEIRPRVCRWLIFDHAEPATSERWLAQARSHLAGYDPATAIGGGTDANFAELNRNRPSPEVLDCVSYAINPQVHAFDNASLAENLAAQAATVESAKHIYPQQPVCVGPVTLRPRFNPVATAPEPKPDPGTLPFDVDPRQMSLFGAGWTVGSLKYLAESGAASVTCYETTGWRGVMETAWGSSAPHHFPSLPGSVFPLYHVFGDLGEVAGGVVIPAVSSDPLSVDGLAVRYGDRTMILIANLTPDEQQIGVEGVGARVRVNLLNETNAPFAMQSPEEFRAGQGALHDVSDGRIGLTIAPFAVVRIDSQLSLCDAPG
jgi:D-apionolactonase